MREIAFIKRMQRADFRGDKSARAEPAMAAAKIQSDVHETAPAEAQFIATPATRQYHRKVSTRAIGERMRCRRSGVQMMPTIKP